MMMMLMLVFVVCFVVPCNHTCRHAIAVLPLIVIYDDKVYV